MLWEQRTGVVGVYRAGAESSAVLWERSSSLFPRCSSCRRRVSPMTMTSGRSPSSSLLQSTPAMRRRTPLSSPSPPLTSITPRDGAAPAACAAISDPFGAVQLAVRPSHLSPLLAHLPAPGVDGAARGADDAHSSPTKRLPRHVRVQQEWRGERREERVRTERRRQQLIPTEPSERLREQPATAAAAAAAEQRRTEGREGVVTEDGAEEVVGGVEGEGRGMEAEARVVRGERGGGGRRMGLGFGVGGAVAVQVVVAALVDVGEDGEGLADLLELGLALHLVARVLVGTAHSRGRERGGV